MNKSNAERSNNKVISGIEKHVTDPQPITIGGKQYTSDQLKAVFQADIDATNAADAARTQWSDALLKARAARLVAAQTRASLQAYIVGLHGPDAVAVVEDFGFTPRSPSQKSVKVKAEALEKSAATRRARHTMGSQQRKAVKGTVTVIAPSDGGTPIQNPSVPGATVPAGTVPAPTVPGATAPAPTAATPSVSPSTTSNAKTS
jgi:hypothetical protein